MVVFARMLPRLTTILIIVVGVVTLSLFFSRPKLYQQEFKAYFKSGQLIRTGAEVRVAGVSSGIVKSVKVRPEHREAPVEVVFEIQTDYQLPIPQDSVVQLGAAGVLGPTFLEVNVSRATGPPAPPHSTLRTLEPELSRFWQKVVGEGQKQGDEVTSADRSPQPPAAQKSTVLNSPKTK